MPPYDPRRRDQLMSPRLIACRLAALTLALSAITACTLPLSAEAHDEWKRSYPLTPGGTVEIRNTNGKITVEAVDGTTVDVVATRSARAGSQEDANNALKRIEIIETVAADRIRLDSSHGMG